MHARAMLRQKQESLSEKIRPLRELIATLAQKMGHPADVHSFGFMVKLLDGETELPVVVYRPKISRPALYPTIFHVPGSAFHTLNPYFAHVTCSQLAEKSNCQVIVINHRLAPEFPFPTGQEDAYQVFCKLLDVSKLCIDKENIFLSGYSSGGAFASVIAHRAAQRNIPIKKLFLISPVTDLSGAEETQKKELEDKDKAVSMSFIESMKSYYLYHLPPTGKNLRHPELSPYWANHFKQFPSTYVVCGGHDRLIGNSLAYVTKLRQSNVKVDITVLEGENHGSFWYSIKKIELIARALRDLVPSVPTVLVDSNARYGSFFKKKQPPAIESKPKSPVPWGATSTTLIKSSRTVR
jgi:acetyl esterase